MLRIGLSPVLLAALAGCMASSLPGPPPAEYAMSNEASVFTAVFDYMFTHHRGTTKQYFPAYFVTLRGKDPGKDFMERWNRHDPPVLPGSKFQPGKGLWLRIKSVKWINKNKAEVFANMYQSDLNNWGRFYRVQKEWLGTWVVVPFNLEVMDDEIDEGI